MATVVDLRQMLANDPRLTSVFLSFSSRLDSQGFRQAIHTNTMIEEVFISADKSFFQECPEDSLDDVFEALGRLPKLRKLCINAYPKCRGIVSMKAINSMVSLAKGLQSLAIMDLEVAGTPQDFAIFAEYVQQMFFLNTFYMTGCNILLEEGESATSQTLPPRAARVHKHQPLSSKTHNEASCSSPLDPLFLSLSMLPSLQAVYLEPKDQKGMGSLSVSAVASLCLSASIRQLKLRNLDLTSEHVMSMASLLEINSTLQSLQLGCLKGGSMDALAAAAFGKMIETNKTLQEFELTLDTMITDASAKVLANALRKSRGLRSFSLKARDSKTIGRLPTQARKAMLQMLQYNYTLEKFFLFRKYPLSREFKHFAKLNQLGRGKLLSGEASNALKDWVQKLASPEVNNDLNSIFYFISCNPTLCMTGAASGTKRSSNEGTESLAKRQRIRA